MRNSVAEWGIALGVLLLAQGQVFAQTTSGKSSQKGSSGGGASGAKTSGVVSGGPAGAVGKIQDPFDVLASKLAELAEGKEWRVGVGNFVFENTELMSPFSAMLRVSGPAE
jgi:hypothetical protein